MSILFLKIPIVIEGEVGIIISREDNYNYYRSDEIIMYKL